MSALSSRLTESGFRTETWHPGASGASEWHRQAEHSNGGTPQDADSQQGQNGRDRRHAKDKKKDGELFGHRITSPRDAHPHIGAGDDEPQRDIGHGRHERCAGIVRGKKPSQQQSRTQEQEPGDKE